MAAARRIPKTNTDKMTGIHQKPHRHVFAQTVYTPARGTSAYRSLDTPNATPWTGHMKNTIKMRNTTSESQNTLDAVGLHRAASDSPAIEAV